MKKQWKRIASAVMMCAVLCLCAEKVNATEIAGADSAIISVEAYEIEEGALVAGEEVTINLTVKNNSAVTDAQNVMVTFDSANYALMPVYGEGNQVYIGNIPAGAAKDITLRAAVNRTYNADAAQLKCYFSYASGSSSLNNTTTIIIPTYISGNLIADSTVVAGNATVGVNSLVSVKYKNASSVDITDAKLVIEGNIQEDTEQKDERKERFVAIYLREVIEDIMEIQVPDSELAILTRSLRGLRYQVPLIKETEKSALEKREPEMFGYMMEVLREIDAKYLLELEDDEEFLCSLFPHLECMIHRMKSEMYFENPILESVKREMFYEYEIASYLVSKFNTKYGIEATEDEIGYITFHIGTSIERTAGNKAKKTVVTLVCMSGVGSSQFMAVKLQRVLPDLKIKRIISSNQTRDLKKEDQDLVISTVPLTLEDIDVVQVSLVLNEEDIQKIQNYVESRRSEKEEKSDYTYLKRFLWEDISILQCDLNSREEVIEVLGKRMIREGYVDEGYVESVFEREKLSDTCVGSLVAIPHAFQGHIRKPGIGLLTLRKPIPWGKETAQIVFMLSLDANVGADFQKIFKAVFNLTKNYKDVEKILKAENLTKLKREIL